MTSQLSTEVERVQRPNENEQQRLLTEIERLQREGRSEAEIVDAMKDMGGRSCSPRPTARRTAIRPDWRLSHVGRSGHAGDGARRN
jgi:hypothetical protein